MAREPFSTVCEAWTLHSVARDPYATACDPPRWCAPMMEWSTPFDHHYRPPCLQKCILFLIILHFIFNYFTALIELWLLQERFPSKPPINTKPPSFRGPRGIHPWGPMNTYPLTRALKKIERVRAKELERKKLK